MTPYELLIRAIERKSQSKATLIRKANVFFMNDQLSEEEYNEIVALSSAI